MSSVSNACEAGHENESVNAMEVASNPAPAFHHAASLSLAVLASSSAGNASVVRGVDAQGVPFVFALDAGLSPKRTRASYEQLGIAMDQVQGVLLTHLDADHWHAGWLAALPDRTTLHLHARQLSRGERMGVTYLRTQLLAGEERDRPGHGKGQFDLAPGVRVRWMLNDHDDHGSVAFRIDRCCGRSVGYVTDLGNVSRQLVSLMQGVSVLAVESNYCPHMQAVSTRPAFLKERIMGGRGHLSNEQSAAFVRAVSPRDGVVLLHLSEECNRPEVALEHHQHAVTTHVASPVACSPWLDASPCDVVMVRTEAFAQQRSVAGQGLLFG